MIGNISFNPIQAMNSFLKPMGLSLSNKDQVIAKVKAVALTIIPLILVSGFSLVSAGYCDNWCANNECGSRTNQCYRDCMRRCDGPLK